jgi:repressor LexA
MDYSSFEQMLKIHNTTVYRVSKETGIAASTFSDWKNGRSCPKAEKLMKIAAFFGVSLDELLGSPAPRRADASSRARRLPIIGEIRAGSPIITDETLLGYEYADVDDADDYFYLKVCGDSMKDCGIVEGALVLFHKQQHAENGDIVACLVDGEGATIKRFSRQGRSIALLPENEDYEPILLSPEDFESGDARILGVAREVKIKL